MTDFQTSSPNLISHKSLHEGKDSDNNYARETILLIGCAGDHPFSEAVRQFPSDYHILIAPLTHPYSIARGCSELAALIKAKAKTVKAHVVGYSLGAHYAIELAQGYPGLVQTLFLTGWLRMQRGFFSPALPYGWIALEKTAGLVLGKGKSKAEETKAPEDRAQEDNLTVATAHETWDILLSDGQLPALQARTLVIAATNGHWLLPTGDSLDKNRTLFEAVRKGNSQSRLAEAKQGRHAWPGEQPKDFADCIISWIRNDEVLPAFLTVEV